MSQLIIEFNRSGKWARKYHDSKVKDFKNIKVPDRLKGTDWIIGTCMDFRDEWRKRLDNHTKNSEYEITVIGE